MTKRPEAMILRGFTDEELQKQAERFIDTGEYELHMAPVRVCGKAGAGPYLMLVRKKAG